MKYSELKNKDEVELKRLLAEQQAELHSLKLQSHTRQLKQVHRIAYVKKTIARIMTALQQQKSK